MSHRKVLPLLFAIITACLTTGYGIEGEGTGKEDWGYVNVRSDAFMFWWLYHTTSPSPQDAPLVMWLQGGPGGSSTGFGNFMEIGPLDVELKPRNTTWLSEASLLFVDNPVGTGFSYVTNNSSYTTDVMEIAQDLVTLFKAFLEKSSTFQAIEMGDIKCNFQGAALGDSWISPVDSVNTWGPYLYATSLVGYNGLRKIQAAASQTEQLVKEGKWTEATSSWDRAETVVEETTNGVNFYNILDWGQPGKQSRLDYWKKLSPIERLFHRHVSYMETDDLNALMNGPIRQKLGIIPKNVTWGGQSGEVFQKQAGDFMKPVIDIVNSLIMNCTALGRCLDVIVYSGQLDLIVDTMGTELWVSQLDNFKEFSQAKRVPLFDPVSKAQSGYFQEYKNFAFYWILDAGHMVPADNGNTALEMLRRVIQKK